MYVAKLEGQQQFEEYYAIACVQKLLDLMQMIIIRVWQDRTKVQAIFVMLLRQ